MTDSTDQSPDKPEDASASSHSIATGGVALAVASGHVDRLLPFLLPADCDEARRTRTRDLLIRLHVAPVAAIGLQPPHPENECRDYRVSFKFQNEASFTADVLTGPREMVDILVLGLKAIWRCDAIDLTPWIEGGAA